MIPAPNAKIVAAVEVNVAAAWQTMAPETVVVDVAVAVAVAVSGTACASIDDEFAYPTSLYGQVVVEEVVEQVGLPFLEVAMGEVLAEDDDS